MKYDIMMLGSITKDVNIDYSGAKTCETGGAVYFSAHAARTAGANVYAAVKANIQDKQLMDQFELPAAQCVLLPSAKTTLMRNQYFTADRERRKASCLAQSDPISACEIPDIPCALYHLAGLLYGDFPNDLIENLAQRGKLSADVQSFLRHNEQGEMNFHDWSDKLQYLPYFDFLKTDAAEAEILTGLTDREAAARQLHAWGAKEIVISHNEEMLAFDGKRMDTYPVKSRNLSGRTGRGDTVFGAYLARRMLGASMSDALRFATALVSLKMETPGPFRGTQADVLAYLDTFYG